MFDREGSQLCFLVACPRSGTTILGQSLGETERITHLYDPYYLWDWFPHENLDDVRSAEDLTAKQRSFLRREYERFYTHSFGNRSDGLIIDQGPEKAFRIGQVRAVFPKAKFLFVVRDGRDVAVSVKREWESRRTMVSGQSFAALWATLTESLGYQPTIRLKSLMLRHEVGGKIRSLKLRDTLRGKINLNKSKWKGLMGWGPRFRGWKEQIDVISEWEFCAQQWLCSNEAIETFSEDLETSGQIIRIRFEDLLNDSKEQFQRLSGFLDVPLEETVGSNLRPSVAGQWQKRLPQSHIDTFGSDFDAALERYGYV